MVIDTQGHCSLRKGNTGDHGTDSGFSLGRIDPCHPMPKAWIQHRLHIFGKGEIATVDKSRRLRQPYQLITNTHRRAGMAFSFNGITQINDIAENGIINGNARCSVCQPISVSGSAMT